MSLELLSVYRWTILAGALSALVLSWIGAHLSARRREVQTIAVSQASSLGALVGLGLWSHSETGVLWLPLLVSVGFSAAALAGSDRLVRRLMVSPNALFTVLFIILMATGQIVDAVLLPVDSHVVRLFFGDLVTVTDTQAGIAIGIAMVSGFALFMGRKRVAAESFRVAIGVDRPLSRAEEGWRIGFWAMSLVMLCFSIQFLGFLFTISTLFVATMVQAAWGPVGLVRHFVLTGVASVLGTGIGFVLSLGVSGLPTTPMITGTILVVSVFLALLMNSRAKKSAPPVS